MKRLIMMALAIGSLAAAGCGKKSADLVGKSKALADRACACKGDEKCLDGVEKDYHSWKESIKTKPDDATLTKLEAEENRMEQCAEGGE